MSYVYHYHSFLDEWLDEHGGRTRRDLQADSKGQYVYMWRGHGREMEKVYIPSEADYREQQAIGSAH